MVCDRSPVLRVQVCINLIKEIERCGIASLDGENKRQRAKTCIVLAHGSSTLVPTIDVTMLRTLLSTTELLDPLLIVMLAIEAHTDADPRIILHRLSTRLLFVRVIFLIALRLAIRLPLDD